MVSILIRHSQFPNSSHLPYPCPAWCPCVCFLHLCFSFCFANKIIYTIGTPLQYSCLENPMDRGAWWAAVHGVAKSRTRLRDFTFSFHFHALEKEMATHSSVLAWRIPGMGEPGRLPSMGSHRVWHDWSDLAAATAYPFSRGSSQPRNQTRVSCIAGVFFTNWTPREAL